MFPTWIPAGTRSILFMEKDKLPKASLRTFGMQLTHASNEGVPYSKLQQGGN
jgi:hypothetical protein